MAIYSLLFQLKNGVSMKGNHYPHFVDVEIKAQRI